MSSYLAILLLYKRFDLIKRTLELLPQAQKNLYINFENRIKKIEVAHNKARKISLLTSQFLRLFDKDARNYLLY
jgi:hypothetical protein